MPISDASPPGRRIPEGDLLLSAEEHSAIHTLLRAFPRYYLENKDDPLEDGEMQDFAIDTQTKMLMLMSLIAVRLDLLLKHYEKLS